ncbi:MAG: hypothetical protein GC157_11835 [Frankiales bacterium]|nr:hypothetical protein [Frankiales bacterium]
MVSPGMSAIRCWYTTWSALRGDRPPTRLTAGESDVRAPSGTVASVADRAASPASWPNIGADAALVVAASSAPTSSTPPPPRVNARSGARFHNGGTTGTTLAASPGRTGAVPVETEPCPARPRG